MTLRRLLGLVGVMAAVAVLASSVGAAPTPARHTIRLSTTAAIKHYLRSLGVSPKGVVIQRGTRNYAGPKCPGKGWACTSTTHPVVQITRARGKNEFQCSTASCAVVQATMSALATNTAKCVSTSGITQSCSISQTSTSANNVAIAIQSATKTVGLTQNGSQSLQIVQRATGGSNGNTACVLQTMLVNTSTVATKGSPVVATLDGHQTASIRQDSANGDNLVENASTASGGSCAAQPLTQSQTISQTATGSGSITQNENAADLGPNLSLDIEQNQSAGFGNATGANTARFSQDNTLTAVASTPVGPVSQTQSSPNGGLLAKVNQFSHGVSVADAHQTETQCEHAQASGPLTCNTPHPPSYSLTQVQYGPVRKGGCCSTQADNPNDTFTVQQSSTQANDTGQSQKNTVQADCTTSGNCNANQQTAIDGQPPATNTQSGQNVNAETKCSGSSCTTFTTSGQQLSASNTNVAEFGFGGMRGNGTGSITVSGVTGPVARAILYWNGPTNSSDPTANANVTFNGSPVTGTNIGFASDNCWGFQNSQSYQADVTSLVTGDGTYSLGNFDKPPDVEVNGASLVVFYNDSDPSNDRNVVLWSGNDSNIASTFDPAGWNETLTGVPYPGSGSASLDFIVSDGQSDGTPTYQDDALVVNGTTLVPAGEIFNGDSTPSGPFNFFGDLWDVKSFDLTGLLVPGSNNINLTTGVVGDCLSLVAFAANVPASAPLFLAPASHPQLQSAAPARAPRPASARGVPSDGALVGRPGAIAPSR